MYYKSKMHKGLVLVCRTSPGWVLLRSESRERNASTVWCLFRFCGIHITITRVGKVFILHSEKGDRALEVRKRSNVEGAIEVVAETVNSGGFHPDCKDSRTETDRKFQTASFSVKQHCICFTF